MTKMQKNFLILGVTPVGSSGKRNVITRKQQLKSSKKTMRKKYSENL
jgi:hypothetical protein